MVIGQSQTFNPIIRNEQNEIQKQEDLWMLSKVTHHVRE